MPKFVQIGNNPGSLTGWTGPYSSLDAAGFNLLSQFGFVDTSTRYFAGYRIAVTGLNMLKWALKSTPTVWNTPVLPFTSNNVQALFAYSDDKIYLSLNNSAGDSRAFRYNVGADTFDALTFPNAATSSSLTTWCAHPNDPDILFLANGSIGGQPTGVWSFRISNGAWTQIGGSGTGWNVNGGVANAVVITQPDGFHLVAAVGGGGANLADVYQSDPLSSGNPFAVWTKIAGGGTNGSWATGTKRGVVVSQISGVLYACLLGATNGDGETWTQNRNTGQWSQIGGDGLNGSWAAGTITVARKAVGLFDKVVVGIAGSGVSDAEGWQYNTRTGLWTQIAGDGLNSSWNNITGVADEFVTRENKLVMGGGSNVGGTSFLYISNPSGFQPESNAGLAIDRLKKARI